MNRIFKSILLAAAAFCALVSCSEKSADEPAFPLTSRNMEGSWKLESWRGQPMPEDSYVYMEFIHKDTRFVTYDNQGSKIPRKRTGKYFIDEANCQVSGIYDYSNKPLDDVYVVSEFSADRMVWTGLSDPDNVSVYVRSEIPSEITGNE